MPDIELNIDLLYAIDLIGTFVFAISGAVTAIRNKFDPVGATALAFVTAVGGGSLRDVLIGSTPVAWMLDSNYLYIILGAVPVSYLFQTGLRRLRRTLFLFDAIGIGLFAVLGTQKALSFDLHPLLAAIMGAVSASFGGVLRDVLCNIKPLIFRKEIYASACMAGALSYLGLSAMRVPSEVSMPMAASVTVTIRILAVKFGWRAPFSYEHE